MKMAVSFSKFQCIYAMLLVWNNLKHGFSVCLKTSKTDKSLDKNLLAVCKQTTSENWVA